MNIDNEKTVWHLFEFKLSERSCEVIILRITLVINFIRRHKYKRQVNFSALSIIRLCKNELISHRGPK